MNNLWNNLLNNEVKFKMCLAIPGKIVKINKDTATIDYSGEKRIANISLIDCKIGDYVIVQQKFAIQKVKEKDAIEALKIFNSNKN